jgi:nucleotide-binding universal stress UspA family protein
MNEDGSPARRALLCFDGSPNAVEAIAEAAILLEGGPALVVHVWEPIDAVLQRSHGLVSLGHLVEQTRDVDAAAAETAQRLATEGAELARKAGFEAEPLALRSEDGVWAGIVQIAEEQDVRAMVLGQRGLSTVGPPRLGSVARAVMEHCKRPTLVVPHPSESQHAGAGS